MNKFLAILYSFVLSFPVGYLKAETDTDPLVTIHVLSKQVRLLKSGVIKKMSITVKRDSFIRINNSDRLVEGRNLTFHVNGGVLQGYLDSRPVTGTGMATIDQGTDERLARIDLDGDRRYYPLPMTVHYGKDDLRFFVKERLNQYCVDSALAEYSGDYWKEKEGILALAHLIRARYFYGKKSHRHHDADFCDLTHCQVYRGRIESSIQFRDEWVIDNATLKDNLFFHARCGGRTLDSGVFSGKEKRAGSHGAAGRDWLYREGIPLCSGRDSHWERTISNDDLCHIMLPDTDHGRSAPLVLEYDRDLLKVHVKSESSGAVFPVETFRLKINRVKGWNFIRSNNFAVSEKIVEGKKYFHFEGEGLGHGVGLCQHGAMSLSRLGYSRYEILEHYYPDIQYANAGATACRSPYCSFCLFDAATGKVVSTSPGTAFLKRKVPPGSIFKLIVALYIAAERPDIFNGYSYSCAGRNRSDANLPERCWKPKGHGNMMMKDAIPNSCNLYFASLYAFIPEKKFRVFYRDFCNSIGINAPLPEISSKKQWAELLAGLDFRMSFTVKDLISIARYFYCGNAGGVIKAVPGIKVPYNEKIKIFKGLQETFIRGTAVEQKKRSGASYNYLCLENSGMDKTERPLTELWGKTSTVIDGTNKPMSYGIFMGGDGTRGIIVVLRKGTGNMASRWARRILRKSFEEE